MDDGWGYDSIEKSNVTVIGNVEHSCLRQSALDEFKMEESMIRGGGTFSDRDAEDQDRESFPFLQRGYQTPQLQIAKRVAILDT